MFLKKVCWVIFLRGENRYVVDTTQNRPGLEQRSLHGRLCFLGGDFESSSPADCEGFACLTDGVGEGVYDYPTTRSKQAAVAEERVSSFHASRVRVIMPHFKEPGWKRASGDLLCCTKARSQPKENDGRLDLSTSQRASVGVLKTKLLLIHLLLT